MTESTEELRPLLAPCRRLSLRAPLRWLALGWRDFRAALPQSLCFGVLSMLASWLVSLAAWRFGDLGLYLGVLSGFVFLGPLLALALYSISATLERGESPSLRAAVAAALAALRDAMVFAIVLLVVFLVWARAASMVHIFVPADAGQGLAGLWLFLLVGCAVGALFAGIVFTASAFSLPMLIDRDADAITAVVSSVNAVLRNKPAALVWAALIGVLALAGIATVYLGFIVLMPLLGYASWHAYREAIDADAWPRRTRGQGAA